ncbi:MAG: BMP family ABC transporter substrate-binding protein [Eubacterium sp.]|nr:BMP family ABC transporter substrate-binding protein [Eubacterium sp.]
MKKIISVLLCIALVAACLFAASGCSKQNQTKSDIVLITNGGTITDGGYNQSAWEGILNYVEEEPASYCYYQPILDEKGELTVANVEKYVELAANNGAQYIVFPGEEFAVSAYELSGIYPDINFILLGAKPHAADDDTDRYIKNVMSVAFDSIEAGFLAGYTAVLNGHTDLGVFGEYASASSQYGAGFVQGAAYAADSEGIPVTVNWADYDSPLLDYDYNFTIKACYDKIENANKTTFTVKVVNGIGSGTYTEGSNVTITANEAPAGQVFDHWEVKSDTEGVKDKKVNISSSSKSEMNLLVEKCDCTITAVYKDIEGEYFTVSVMDETGKNVVSVQSVSPNGECWVEAPVASENMVFDHWETSASEQVENIESKGTMVKDVNSNIELTPIYAMSDAPTFNITVETGEGGSGESLGSGSYRAGDKVVAYAAIPEEGYMFSHWENTDAYGYSTGISMENEYYWNTSFEMVDRYAAVCEEMFDRGATAVFNGGNTLAQSAFTAKWNFDYDLSIISAGEKNKDAYITAVNDYRVAVLGCLKDFKGGSVYNANCANESIYLTYVANTETEQGKAIQEKYDAVYKALADGKINLIRVQEGAGYDFCKQYQKNAYSKCLTLNDMFLTGAALG